MPHLQLVFPPGEFIQDELDARGWTVRDLAERMGGDVGLNQLTMDLLIHAPSKGMLVGAETSAGLARAFGVSEEFFLNLDRLWQEGSSEETR